MRPVIRRAGREWVTMGRFGFATRSATRQGVFNRLQRAAWAAVLVISSASLPVLAASGNAPATGLTGPATVVAQAAGGSAGNTSDITNSTSGITSSSDSGDASACSSETIRMADQTWESASFITQVIRLVLTHGFGCTVDVVPGTTAATESALVQNDLQIIAEQWSGRSPIIEQGIQQGALRVVGDTLKGGAEQGWYVPDYVVQGDPSRNIEPMAPNLVSWRDLPEYKTLFRDPEVPDKGRFLNCPTGWVCEQTNSRLLEIHGLTDDYTNFRAGTGAALDSAISSAYERGEPILFYYWQPAGLMAKYNFHKIQQEPFNQTCWDAIVSGEGELCPSDFLLARLGVAVSTPFADTHPQLIEFFERMQFEPDALNGAILTMTEQRLDPQRVAVEFLRSQPAAWTPWVPEPVARQLKTALQITDGAGATPQSDDDRITQEAATASSAGSGGAADEGAEGDTDQGVAGNVDGAGAGKGAGVGVLHEERGIFPNWSLIDPINRQVMQMVQTYGSSFRDASNAMLTRLLLPVERALFRAPAWLILLLTGVLALHATRKPVASFLYVVGLYAIGAVGLWDKLIQTFSLVLVATLLSIVIGVPLGILGARIRVLRRIMTPVMDVMQTLPSFVYLIPVLMLFGLGKVPAVFATIIYAVPPLIRLTILGLRHVDHDVTEAAQSFGVTPWQMLHRVSLPLARPSIMAGINQATMMALSMVVVASMIGARGLGEDVLAGIQTLDVGRGLQAGAAIVILAIVMDRITQAYGHEGRRRRSKTRRRQRALADTAAATAPAVPEDNTDARREDAAAAGTRINPATGEPITQRGSAGEQDTVEVASLTGVPDKTVMPGTLGAGEADGVRPSSRAPSDAARLVVQDVYKVFGAREAKAVALLKQGVGKEEVQARTGCTVGLAGVSVDIPPGVITCVMGLSGSGKSTLIRHMNRLIDPSAGEILLDGQNILQLSLAELRTLRRYSVSMVFQNFGLLPHLTVLENTAFGLRVRGESTVESNARAKHWLTQVGLAGYGDHYPDELSGGMRQRVGLARALATDARVLLMDEAFSALDPLIRFEMQDQLLDLQARLLKTVVFVTHDIDEALRLGSHIVILRDGKVEQEGTPDDIRNAPVNEYVRRFVARRGT